MFGKTCPLGVAICLCFIASLPSCTPEPTACFTITPNMDSIHVNQQVTFNATCSYKSHQFYWQFYNNADSIAYGESVTKVFYDTGKVDVMLLVSNGNNSNSATDSLYVQR